MISSLALKKTQIKYQLLSNLGISLWKMKGPSKNNFPLLSESCSRYASLAFVVNAHCLVLLPENPNLMNEAEQKIFKGMLKVLPISTHNLNVTWIPLTLKTPSPTFLIGEGEILSPLIRHYVSQCAPYTVLIMGQAFATTILENTVMKKSDLYCQITFHPSELLKDPSNRAQAYQDLLKLKTHLQAIGVK